MGGVGGTVLGTLSLVLNGMGLCFSVGALLTVLLVDADVPDRNDKSTPRSFLVLSLPIVGGG